MRQSRTATDPAPANSKLSTYLSKRDPTKTPEPMNATLSTKRDSKALPLRFVIQEHHAKALHWDFRLERDGVLVSWALPKGLPIEPGANHLAIHTEDHPLDYGDFEGEIPDGEYGAGDVSIWDRGTYDTQKWRDDELMFTLHGQRASGRFVLFSTGDKKWMIHRMDPAPKDFEPMPENVAPMLAKSGGIPEDTLGWASEFKWDGVRAILYVDGGRVRALTRNGKNLNLTFPELRDVGLHLGSRSAVLDGEIVVMDSDGLPNFSVLSQRLHLTSKSSIAKLAQRMPAIFFAFDVLYLEGRSLLDAPYDQRRAVLASLELQGNSFATPPSITDVPASDILRISRERGLEGVVLKRRDSLYEFGQRSDRWIKVKNVLTQEVVIGGWTDGKGEREGSIGALLVGVPRDGALDYVGKVGTGFSLKSREELLKRLTPLAHKKTPFHERLSSVDTAATHFVRPSLVGEVQFAQWTPTGHLRHPTWRGLRQDKVASEVVRES